MVLRAENNDKGCLRFVHGEEGFFYIEVACIVVFNADELVVGVDIALHPVFGEDDFAFNLTAICIVVLWKDHIVGFNVNYTVLAVAHYDDNAVAGFVRRGKDVGH